MDPPKAVDPTSNTSDPNLHLEHEPHAPSLSTPPSDITHSEGYKSGLKLLQLVFQEDHASISREALEYSSTLQEGLSFLKQQGFDLMQEIQRSALERGS